MFICLCNGFTDGNVRKVTRGTGCSVAEVYRALGCKPQCGKCVPFVRDLIRETVGGEKPSSFDPSASLLLAGTG
jgi:bacterioferritin-associated ferredoxin